MISLAKIQTYNADKLVDRPIIAPNTSLVDSVVTSKDQTLKTDNISISNMAKQMLKIDQLNQQICCAFEGDKQLTKPELKQRTELLDKINHVHGYPDAKPPTADKALADKISHQISIVISDGQVTFEQEQKLVTLSARVNISEPAVKENTLTSEQQQQLTGLFKQLDELHGVKKLHKEQLLKVQDMFTQIDQLKGTMAGDQSGIYHF